MARIIITGSSRGIGLAATNKFLQEGYEVIGTSTSGTHQLIHENFTCHQLDLGNPNSVIAFVNNLNFEKFNYLINNAAILLEEWDNAVVNMEQLIKTFEVNLFGTIRLTELLLPKMQSEGHIINISSAWGSFSEYNFDEFVPHYKMSKAALNMYTKLLSKRLEIHNIKVSSFNPGWVKTDMGGNAAAKLPKEVANELLNLLMSDVESGKFWSNNQISNW